jgi:uncharacterized membrane protein YhhN
MKIKIISLFYFLAAVLFLILGGKGSFFPAFIAKALIIPVLMILFLTKSRSGLSHGHRLMLAGLFFSWAGDVALEFSHANVNMFIIGLVCFLLAHVMYFTVFIITPGENVILSKRVYFLIPVLLYGAGLLYYLYDDLGQMRVPVIIYSAVILTMLSGSINRLKKVNSTSFYLVLAGAILFVISDSAIAINKFSYQFDYSSVVIMSTYVLGQYLIVTGYLNQYNEN